MSIITEALKKAEEESQKDFKKADKTDGAAFEEFYKEISKPVREKSKINVLRSFLIILASALFLTLISLMIITRNEKPVEIASIPASQLLPETQDKSIIEKPQVSDEIKDEIIEKPIQYEMKKEIVLNGIMYSKNKPLAVINDLVVKEGEEISDIKILKIKPSSVDIETNGEVKTLYIKGLNN